MLSRTQILNLIIFRNKYKKYLEIGLDNAKNFKSIECDFKESCDPMKVNDISISKYLTYNKTSDDMFNYIHPKYTFDIIFIDGLHTKEQVWKDIINSQKHLNEGGVIVLHDCLPTEEQFQKVPRETTLWNGDVWKVLPILKFNYIKFETVDSDSGCCIIPYQEEIAKLNPVLKGPFFEYNQVFNDIDVRNNTLSVISETDFLKKLIGNS